MTVVETVDPEVIHIVFVIFKPFSEPLFEAWKHLASYPILHSSNYMSNVKY